MSHKLPVNIIFLDYVKAFDKVPHKRLLKQLEIFGIKDNLLIWKKSFLTLRQSKALFRRVPKSRVVYLQLPLYVNDIPDVR